MDWKRQTQEQLNRSITLFEGIQHSTLVQYTMRHWHLFSPSTRALPVYIWQAIINFKNRGTRQAAALSYYAIFSMFPLTLLLAVAVSGWLGPAVAQEQISQGLILFLPEETDTINLFQDSLEQALQQSRSFGLFAIIGLTWSALGLFSNLTSSLDLIFQAHTNRSMWRQRVLAFFMTLVFIALIIISFIASGVLNLLDAVFLSNASVWIMIGTFFLPLGINLIIFVLLFRYVPSRYVNWEAIWPSAIFGAIAFELVKTAFGWYLSNLADYQFVYGSIATVIVLLLWAFVMFCIFLIAAEICAQLNLWLNNRDTSSYIRVLPETLLAQLPAEIPPPV